MSKIMTAKMEGKREIKRLRNKAAEWGWRGFKVNENEKLAHTLARDQNKYRGKVNESDGQKRSVRCDDNGYYYDNWCMPLHLLEEKKNLLHIHINLFLLNLWDIYNVKLKSEEIFCNFLYYTHTISTYKTLHSCVQYVNNKHYICTFSLYLCHVNGSNISLIWQERDVTTRSVRRRSLRHSKSNFHIRYVAPHSYVVTIKHKK